MLISGRRRKMHAGRRNDRGRSSVRRAPRKANRAWIAFEERAKSRLVLFPFTAWEGKCLNKEKIEDFAVKRTIRNVLGIELVAAALFVDPIKYLVHAFLVVFVLDEMLLY